MKSFSFKSLLPHLMAIGVFLLIALIVCRPALESDTVLKRSDMTIWHGMSQQSLEHEKQTGVMPLWVTSMFGGMPGYQIAMNGGLNPFLHLDGVFKLWLPVPISYFFLSCICFYFLGMCLRMRTASAIFGAVAFAYCSYNPIIITAGHETKMLAIAYCPAVIGACLLIFRKKYLLGFTLAAVFTSLQIAQGHQQISYYLFLILVIMGIAYLVRLIKAKENKHAGISMGLLVLAGTIGILLNAVTLFTTYDYTKESKRGGQLVMPGDEAKKEEKVVNGKTTGLSKEYAFQWSYGKLESMSLMFPGVMGYGNHSAQRDGENYYFPQLKEDANAVNFISQKLGAPVEQAQQYASQSLYWGDQPFTNGPVYLGAIVCFLFIMSLFYLDGKDKWWLLIASILGILLAMGSNLPGFNYLMFDYLPFYNKFRAVTMSLIIPQILFPIGAAMFLDKLATDEVFNFKKLKMGGIATALMFVAALGIYATSDFASENRQRTNKFNEIVQSGGADVNTKLDALNRSEAPLKDNQVYEGMFSNLNQSPNAAADARSFLTALRQDRASLFLGDIGKSFLYVLLAASLIFAYCKRYINGKFLLIGAIVLTLIDQVSFTLKYLNDKNFDSKELYESQEFPITNADKQIMADKDPNFRVFDLANGSPFENSKAAYYHKSIGGNHAAKLGIYDDLIAHQLSGQPNLQVLNMLNTRYIMQRQENDVVVSKNDQALGNAWFVKAIKYVNGPVAEMSALTSFNPKDTAIVDESFKSIIGNISVADSTASIRLTSFDNDKIIYESNSNGTNAAIFSEVYYKDWTATIDGKSVPIFKANYVLRGLVIPAGKHNIVFEFKPKVFTVSKLISQVTGWLLIALILFCIFAEWKKRNNNQLSA